MPDRSREPGGDRCEPNGRQHEPGNEHDIEHGVQRLAARASLVPAQIVHPLQEQAQLREPNEAESGAKQTLGPCAAPGGRQPNSSERCDHRRTEHDEQEEQIHHSRYPPDPEWLRLSRRGAASRDGAFRTVCDRKAPTTLVTPRLGRGLQPLRPKVAELRRLFRRNSAIGANGRAVPGKPTPYPAQVSRACGSRRQAYIRI